MEYFATEFNLNILRKVFQFWKWLEELQKHVLNKSYISPKTRALISRVYPLILRPELGLSLLLILAKC